MLVPCKNILLISRNTEIINKFLTYAKVVKCRVMVLSEFPLSSVLTYDKVCYDKDTINPDITIGYNVYIITDEKLSKVIKEYEAVLNEVVYLSRIETVLYKNVESVTDSKINKVKTRKRRIDKLSTERLILYACKVLKTSVVESDNFCFDFANKVYEYKGNKYYLTPSEELYILEFLLCTAQLYKRVHKTNIQAKLDNEVFKLLEEWRNEREC